MAASRCCCRKTSLLFTLFLFIGGNGDRTSDKVYINLDGSMPCFRRLNGTHQFGCASLRGGSVGVLQVVNSTNTLDDVLQRGPNHPYVLVLTHAFFNSTFLTQMRDSGKVSGALVLYPENEGQPLVSDFSPDQTCPNRDYGLYRGPNADLECKVKWNSVAQNLLFEDWGFPIFLMRSLNDSQQLQECYDTFNSPESGKADEWPLCAAELKSNMYAAKDSKTCIRRSHLVANLNPSIFCDPLGDQNIWSTLVPTNKSTPQPNQSLIVVAARLDAASLFEGFTPGADTTVTGLVTLLAIAHALAKEKKEFSIQKNVMFALFNGESFDYIGSSRMVYEMEKGRFPTPLDSSVSQQPSLINLTTISHFLELNQLSNHAYGETIYVHTDPVSLKNSDVKQSVTTLFDVLHREAKKYNLSILRADSTMPLPSSSLQSFLWKNSHIPGVVLTDHNAEYTNRYYNGMYDVAGALGVSFKKDFEEEGSLQKHLAKIASTVAETVYYTATKNRKIINITASQINELLICYLNNSNCDLFLESSEPEKSPAKPRKSYSLYVSVNTYVNAITVQTLQLLAYFTGEVVSDTNKDKCHKKPDDQTFRYIWMHGPKDSNETGVCYRTTANYSKAESPAFDIEDYDWSSGQYSSWTESQWEPTSVRIFLKPSRQWEAITLSVGFIILAVSIGLIWCLNRNAHIVFVSTVGDC